MTKGGIIMSKKDGITLSEKYGVNPSLIQCFYCGESKGIALMGHIGDRRKHEDIEAPKECVMDYEPCDKCKENMSLGVTLIEVTMTQPQDQRPPVKAQGGFDVYPTSRWCVITEEASQRIFEGHFKKGDKVFIDPELFDKIMGNDE